MTAEPPQPKKTGCFLRGCLTLLALLGAAVVLVFLVALFGILYLRSYTAAEPTPFPVLAAQPLGPDAELGTPTVEDNGDLRIAYTSEDINRALAATMRDAPVRIRFRIERSLVFADFTLPVDHALAKAPIRRIPGFSGRHLNGTIAFTPALSEGTVRLALQNAALNGKPLGGKLRTSLQKKLEEGLNAGLRSNYVIQGYLLMVRRLEVQDDRLIVHMVNIVAGE